MLRIIIVGYMGSGKTTVGKALAEALGLSFYDLDWCVESRYHRTVPQLFAERGEEGFRELERRLLHEVAEFEDIVLACGGGTPCFFDNMDFITSQAQTVYLKATPETLAMHLRMGKVERPLIKGKTPEQLTEFIRDSLAQREPFYSRAHHTLCVDLLENFSKIKITVQLIRDLLKV
ncbi:MAG: shikimate kinase [Bacteroidaceae bacterium]|nr:shikimate kinase [Bacteroidaceae bacterium]